LETLKGKTTLTKGEKDSLRYYTNLLRAMPSWLTTEHFREIKKIYTEAHRKGLVVDHIVPLKSQFVCGLHVPWNLEGVPRAVNVKKGNLWWPDSPFSQAGLDF
jgi:hypothetical protein